MALESDRPSMKRMVLTFVGIVAAIGAAAFAATLLLDASLAPTGVSTSTSVPATLAAVPETAAVEPTLAPEPVAEPVEPVPVTSATVAPPTPIERPSTGVVCIDPGHQAMADSSLEPVGPGASERKPKVAGGARGVVTRNPESLVNLQVSLKLRDELKRRGITVVMVRTTQDVNIANSERAQIANDANADLFIRIHCDGSATSSMRGLSTLIPKSNTWTAPIVAESAKAGKIVHRAVIASTHARDRGVVTRGDLSGFNWSKVPTILVEMGFMSNPEEDRLLGTSAYQQKLADGMADGIVEYMGSR